MLNTPIPPIIPNNDLENKLLSYEVVTALIGSTAAITSRMKPIKKLDFILLFKKNNVITNMAE